jgi:hypothetical protein
MENRSLLDPEVLADIVEGSGLSYDQNSVSWIFTCPRCGKAKKLYLRKRDGRFVCWRCKETDGFQGRAEYALSELLGEHVKDVAKKLYGDVPLTADLWIDVKLTDFFGDGDQLDDEFEADEVVQWPYDFYPIDAPEAHRGRGYLAGRGIPSIIAKEYDVRYCPVTRRVYFPVGANGNLFGWQGRLIIPHEYEIDGEIKRVPKILSSENIKREHRLMFADRLRGSEHAVVTEGPFDAIKAHYCGGNVSTMGKAISPGQIELLRCCGVKKIYLALDPDAAEETQRLVHELGGDVELYEMVPEGMGKVDIGALRFDEAYELFLNAPRIEPGRVFVFVDPRV